MNRITQQNIVSEILDKAKKETTFTEKEEIKLRELNALSKKLGIEYVSGLKLRLTRPNREECAGEVCNLFRDGLKDWAKEDLLFALAALSAGIAANDLFDAGMIT